MINDNTLPWLKHYDKGVSPHIAYPKITLPEILKTAAVTHPSRDCIIHKNQKITFSELERSTSQVAISLQEQGIQRGDRVGIIMENTPGFVTSFFSILKAGGVVVAINPNYKIPEIEYIVEDSDIKVLIVGSSKESLSHALRQIKSANLVLKVNDLPIIFNDNASGRGLFHLVKEEKNSPIDNEGEGLPIITPEDPAIFQYSGGTTGIPKAAVGLHRNLVANVYQFSEWLKWINKSHPIFLSVIPFYHVYGMVLAMCLPIQMGGTMLTLENLRSMDEFMETISFHKPDVFPCVPSLFRAMIKSPLIQNLKKGDLKICISGSAPLEEDIMEGFETKTGAKILEGYGLSEAPTATHCNPLAGRKKIGSIGLPLPDVESKIVDMENGDTELRIGEEGELIIRGPQVMNKYYNRESETRTTLRNGWLYTGDIARMDEEGYTYITGRKKDLIKVSGFQVWPLEIESVIRRYSGVADVVVAGIYDENTGERPKAWILPGEDFVFDILKLQRFCKNSLADYKVPKEIEVVSEFPRSNIGKVLRRELIRLDHEKKHPG
jgi:long-chain acyl-CoA synthetase